MRDLFLDLDGEGELTLWEPTERPDYPKALIRRCDVPARVWLLILKGLNT